MISHSRGYLPHLELPEGTYFVTFRLADSLPASVLIRLKEECFLSKALQLPQNILPSKDEYHNKIEELLDKGAGECWLKDPNIAKVIVDALRRYDAQHYYLHAWTVMPNHVHVLFTTESTSTLSLVVQGWKGATAFQANRILARTGRFWQPEYFDVLGKQVGSLNSVYDIFLIIQLKRVYARSFSTGHGLAVQEIFTIILIDISVRTKVRDP